MLLTSRDIEVVNFVESVGGATIEQIQMLFFPSYDMAKKRLKKLEDNKFLKGAIHPVLGKKTYYTKKIPSFHRLEVTTIEVLMRGKYKLSEREYNVNGYKVDLLMVLNDNRILVVEIDIFNRTTDKKISDVQTSLSATKAKVEFVIVSKRRRRSQAGNKYKMIMVGDEKKILTV